MSNGEWQEPNLSLCPSLITLQEDGEMYAWDAHQVALWVADLDDTLKYASLILEQNGVDGEQLAGNVYFHICEVL